MRIDPVLNSSSDWNVPPLVSPVSVIMFRSMEAEHTLFVGRPPAEAERPYSTQYLVAMVQWSSCCLGQALKPILRWTFSSQVPPKWCVTGQLFEPLGGAWSPQVINYPPPRRGRDARPLSDTFI